MVLFKTPFSVSYWRAAWHEVKSVQMLVIAALFVAIRLVLKSIQIPVGDSLNISAAFFANALGAIIYGPVLASISGIVCDIIGCILFPKGPYFFPFTIVEMLGSLIFALYLYRVKLSPVRIFLSKLTVNLVCNITLTPLLLSWMYGKAVSVYLIPHIAKNLIIFPLEAVLLTFFIGIMLPVIKKAGIDVGDQPNLKITVPHIAALTSMFVLSISAVVLYYVH